tara:strand:+ start:838 stop:1065 length:228 start_codon:yes stop_codon:yes gene_type:complete
MKTHTLKPILELLKLRWDVDHLVYLTEYESHYWLKACYNSSGERIGITSCCEYGFECEHHKSFKDKVLEQKSELN